MCIDAFDTNTYIQTYFPPTDDQLFCRLLARAHKSTSTTAVKDRICWVSPNVLRHHSLSLSTNRRTRQVELLGGRAFIRV